MQVPRPLRILHIGPDSQFLQFAARTFEEVAPGANSYIVISDSVPRHPIDRGPTTVVRPTIQGAIGLLARRVEADLVIAHSMTVQAAAVFSRMSRSSTAVWSGWGYDYYGSDSGSTRDLLGPTTAALVDDIALPSSHPILSHAFDPWYSYARRLVRRAAARTDFFSAPVPTDEPVFRIRFPRFHGEYAQLSYASLEESFGPGASANSAQAASGGILVGNSATPTNNHVEIFDLLAGSDLGGRTVVVPLNYGDPRYRDAVVERGSRILGDAFRPLIELLPLDEYNRIVAGCDVVIMNQRRQQALGNIGTALNAGAEVVLDEINPVFAFLRGEGVTVRSTGVLRSGQPVANTLLPDEVARNRAFLERFWGAQRVRDNAAALVAKAQALAESRGSGPPESPGLRRGDGV